MYMCSIEASRGEFNTLKGSKVELHTSPRISKRKVDGDATDFSTTSDLGALRSRHC